MFQVSRKGNWDKGSLGGGHSRSPHDIWFPDESGYPERGFLVRAWEITGLGEQFGPGEKDSNMDKREEEIRLSEGVRAAG